MECWLVGTAFIGPIQLYERSKATGKTAPQTLISNQFDSRLAQSLYPLSYRKIRELRKDPTIKLARWAVLSPMLHTPWIYEKANNKNPSKEMLNFIEENFTEFRDWFLLQSVFGVSDFGWQPFEVSFIPDKGTIWLDNIKPLLQDYTDILVYIDTGKFAGFVNEPPSFIQSVVVDKQYALNANFEIEGTDWYGSSVFEDLWPVIESWKDVERTANRYDKKIAGAVWAVYYPVGQTPYNGTLTANDEIAKDILNRLEASGGVTIPDEIQEWVDEAFDSIDQKMKGKWRIELISAKASVQTSFIDRQKYLDALKMRAFGFPERSILEGKHGTKEEADVHADIAVSIVDSKHRLLCTQLNAGPVATLMRLNYGEEWANAVCIKPAPMVDTQFGVVKRIYELILQNPETLVKEAENIDTKEIRDMLGIISRANKPLIPDTESEMEDANNAELQQPVAT